MEKREKRKERKKQSVGVNEKSNWRKEKREKRKERKKTKWGFITIEVAVCCTVLMMVIVAIGERELTLRSKKVL